LDQDHLKELISDHASHPRNKYQLEQATCTCHGKNPLCGDEITIQIRLSSCSSSIEKIAFLGRGCPISQASASIVTEVCSGLSSSDASALASHLRNVITTGDQSEMADHLESAWSQIEGLAAIQVNPSRVKCVMLAWHTLAHALRAPGKSNTVF
tara:strand:+ start:229 stop:690 length:462 start_codon:yes stop_codon:yes gene_type:complete